MSDEQRPFRILALDGGGIKGAFTAAFLDELERMTGRRIVDHFDLIAGTSTGGIIAVAIGLQVDLQRILDLYAAKGPVVFPPSPRLMFLRQPRGWLRPKFDPGGLRNEVERAFGARRLGESRCRLLITAFNADDGDVKLIKTAHHARFKRDYRLRAVDVALATSAAPTYFPAHQIEGDAALIDGGVWANCPALAAVIEAITVLGVPGFDVDVLSVGTTDEPFDIPLHLRRGGKAQWARRAAGLLMRAQEVGSIAQAELLTRSEQRWDGLLRVNPPVRPGRFKLGSIERVRELIVLGRKHAEHQSESIERRFLRHPAAPFAPSYAVEAMSINVPPVGPPRARTAADCAR